MEQLSQSTPGTAGRRSFRDDDAIALITVLWGVTLLALMAVIFSSSVQIETRATTYERDAAQAYGFACGGIQTALFEMGYPQRPDQEQPGFWNWREGQLTTVIPFPGGRAVLEVVNESGKVDLNLASGEQLVRLFEARGLSEGASLRLAGAILDWRAPAASNDQSQALDEAYQQAGYRPRHAPFGSVEELLRLPGMTRGILYGTFGPAAAGKFRRMYGLDQDLTVFSKSATLNLNYASPAALASLPGVDRDLAAAIAQERARAPFRSVDDANLRLAGALSGDALPFLTTASNGYYTLVSVGEVAGSRVRRAVRAVIAIRAAGLAGAPSIVLWYDDDFLHGVG